MLYSVAAGLPDASTDAVIRRRRRVIPGPARSILLGGVLPIALLAIWQAIAARHLIRPNLLPPPQAVVTTLKDLAASGALLVHLGATLWRLAIGFAAGVALAVPIAAATGLSPRLHAIVDPTIQMVRAIPSIAWVPLFILWLGIGETTKVALIALGVFLPVYLNLATAIIQLDRKLIEAARAFGLRGVRLARRVILPAALPGLMTGLRSGLGLGWMFVVAAELMGASEGLGFLMIDGQSSGRPALVLAAILLFAVCGKASDLMLVLAGKRLLAWQDNLAGGVG